MNEPCTKLHLFVDGELSATEAEGFRLHLTRCAACEAGLRDLLQMELLAARALGGAQAQAQAEVTPLRRSWQQRALRTGVPLALAASLAVVLVSGLVREPKVPPEVWLAHLETRDMEMRLSHAGADRYQRYEPMRGGEATSEVLPLGPLAKLEKRQDYRGIAAAYAVRGDWRQAEAFLVKAPESPDKANDLAVVALGQKQWERALGLLTGALETQPRHPQALWNRGLALRELKLLSRAAASFEEVAALNEPGWSDAARRLAKELRAEQDSKQVGWRQRVREAWEKLPGASDSELKALAQQPALARAALYEAVRTAPTRDVVEALLPLAHALDSQAGGTVLQDYVHQVAARDFQAREPLARQYAQLLRGHEVSGLVKALADSAERDIYFGALVLTGAAARDEQALTALQRFAKSSGDPWLELLAERERARREATQGRLRADEDLLAALKTCSGYQRAFHCEEIH